MADRRYRCPSKLCGWESTLRPTTWPCCPNCLVYEDIKRRVIEPDVSAAMTETEGTDA